MPRDNTVIVNPDDLKAEHPKLLTALRHAKVRLAVSAHDRAAGLPADAPAWLFELYHKGPSSENVIGGVLSALFQEDTALLGLLLRALESRKSGIRIAPTSGERSIISRLEWELVELWLRPSLQSFDQSFCYYTFEALARFFNVHTPRPGAEWKAQEIRYQCRKLGLMRSERILFRDIQFLGMEGAMRLFRGVQMKGVVLLSNGNPKTPRSGTGGKSGNSKRKFSRKSPTAPRKISKMLKPEPEKQET